MRSEQLCRMDSRDALGPRRSIDSLHRCHRKEVKLQFEPLDPSPHDQKAQKRTPNLHTIVWFPHSTHSLSVRRTVENALFVSPLEQLGHDIAIKFRVSLNGNEASWSVHALYLAAGSVAQRLNSSGHVVDDVAVHLVDTLRKGRQLEFRGF